MRNKKAIVVGGTGGLGFAICEELVNSKFDVVSFGRNNIALDKLTDIGCNAISIDFYSNDWIRKFSKHVKDVDVLINSAGLFELKNINNSVVDDFDKIFNLNVRVPFLTMKMCLSEMEIKGCGRVINILSSSAYNDSHETGLYCASKQALLGLTRSAFLEYRPKNIFITSVSPGSLQTSMGKKDIRQEFNSFINPKEVASFLVHSLSTGSSMIMEEVRLNRTIIR